MSAVSSLRYRTLGRILSIVANEVSRRRKMFSIVTKTWNPITGCKHMCVYCWARRLAEERLRGTRKYSRGFEPVFHPGELRRAPSEGMIFVSDMGDMWGSWVPREWIEPVLAAVRSRRKALFLFLTKNPARYHEFADMFSDNCILGATIETNRDDLYRSRGISKAPLPSERYRAMKDLSWELKFISIEPVIDFDLDVMYKWITDIDPIMVYIGYDNYDNRLPEPPVSQTLRLISALEDAGIPVIRKTIPEGDRLNQRLV